MPMNSPWAGHLKAVAPFNKRTYRILCALSTAVAVANLRTAHPSAAATTNAHTVVRALTQAEQTAMRGVVWKPGCPVALADLRRVDADVLGIDGSTYRGTLVVHRSVAAAVARILARLYEEKFAIRSMVPIEAFGGDDDRSTMADNSSAFNCRTVQGSRSLSEHAYGRAIDLNPVENPYVRANGSVLDPAAERFTNRASVGNEGGVITGDGPVVKIFRREGWGWGGSFKRTKDYQHFSTSGR